MKSIYLMLSVFVTLTLTACGGGGSSSDPLVFSLSIASSTLTMNEGETANVPISYNNASGNVSLVTTSETLNVVDYQLTTSSNNANLSLSVTNIEQDQVVHFTLNATDREGNQTSKNLTVNVVNTSLIPKVIELKSIQDNIENIYALQEERDLIDVLLTLALLNNDVDTAEVSTYKSRLDTVIDDAQQAEINVILNSFNTSSEAMAFPTLYIESEVDSALATLYENLSTYVDDVNTIIVDVQNEMTLGTIEDIPLGEFYYSSSQASISQFYGNPELGTWGTTNAFDNKYLFLEKIVLPEEQVCN